MMSNYITSTDHAKALQYTIRVYSSGMKWVQRYMCNKGIY
jgi:hypothetical protein